MDAGLGFAGPKKEAEEIRQKIGEFLEKNLRLTLSLEKTLITHAVGGKAKFLGYEITASKENNRLTGKGKKRYANRCIALLMPKKVERKFCDRFCEGGKPVHRTELLAETDYTIIQRYQSVLRGLYNYYCMAVNVSKRMNGIKRILETSLTKTLASKLRCSVQKIYKRYRVIILERKVLRVIIERPGKEPLVAVFGGIPFERNPEGQCATDFRFDQAWLIPADKRAEVVQRLLADKCELCGKGGPVEVHHIRKLADIDRPGRRPRANWEKVMAARKRKTLVLCVKCHRAVTQGEYDGSRI
jgi:hypothetical protein